MKTLVVFYSKTGNSKKVANAAIKELDCDYTELIFDESEKVIKGGVDPSGYEHVIMICPVWAFELAEPMKLYLKVHGEAIQNYSLIVTCGLFGLRTCVNNCVKAIKKRPVKTVKIKDKRVKENDFDIKEILR